MPIQVLVNVISTPVLAPAAVATVPHGLKQAGAGVVPTFILPDRGTNIAVVSADATSVTFQNNGGAPDSARFRCEYGLSTEVDHAILPVFWSQGLSGPGSGGAPTGPAGGDLAGSTYPNPIVAPGAINDGKIAAGAAIAVSKLAVGPANTVLRSNGAANAFGALNLATDVTGTLPEANQADQTMGGDVSGSTGAATVTGLQGRPVDATAPTAGQLVGWSGSAWAPVSAAPGGGGGGGNTYYLNYSVAGQAPVPTVSAAELDYTFSGSAGTSVGPIAVAQDTDPTPYTVLAQFVTKVGDPGVTTIPPGIWEVGLYALADVATNAYLRFRLSKWNGVTLTDLALADFVQVTDTTAPAILVPIDVFVPTTTLTATERLVITLEGQRDVAAARNITIFFEGTTVSHVHTSFNAPGGTGVVKVFNGVIQDPASLITDADVAIGAGINPSKLSASSVTVNAGSGLSGGGTVALGGSITLSATTPSGGSAATGSYRAVSSADAFVIASDYLLNSTGAGSFTVTLPSAVTATAGRVFVLKHSGTGTITVATTSGQTIDGAASLTVSVQFSSYTFMSDGSNWIII